MERDPYASRRCLADGQTLTDSRVGIGDFIVQATTGAAAAAGSAAGLVIAAPVAVVDQNTGENYGEVEGLTGQAVDDAISSIRAMI